MRRIATIAAGMACVTASACVVLGPGTAVGGAVAGCEVGGKPTLFHEAQDIYEDRARGKVVAGPVVVGCGRSGGEPLEIVAYSTTKYFCFQVDRPAESREGGTQDLGCKQNRARWVEFCSPDPCFVSFPAGPIDGSKLTRTIVGGVALAPAARVEVTAGADGRSRSFPVVEARVEAPRLLGLLRQSQPLFLFAALLPRCYPRAVRVTTFDAAGAELASEPAHGPFFANECRLTFRG